ncbi:hypothetical protein NC652_027313 [Populus alba x Populus x berolinensis]|nr:hypothetical protein NC652_027313 [Populus alba x Populus x berolinensis]
MSSVLVMLASDIITLPIPKRPAFSVGRLVAVEAQSSNQKVCSVNEVLSPRGDWSLVCDGGRLKVSNYPSLLVFVQIYRDWVFLELGFIIDDGGWSYDS